IGRTTQPAGSEGPLLHRCVLRTRSARMSAAATARSIRREDTSPAGRPLDKVQALQWTLYRCAKQDPERRFHALYGHILRRDVLWRGGGGGGGKPGGRRAGRVG